MTDTKTDLAPAVTPRLLAAARAYARLRDSRAHGAERQPMTAEKFQSLFKRRRVEGEAQ